MSAGVQSMQQDLLTTVDRVCEAHCDRALREAAEAGTWPAALWEAFEEVGLPRAALPESAGGAGLDFADAMLALRRSAFHAAPVPLAETILAGRMLHAAGLEVPAGAITVAPVVLVDSLKVNSKTVTGEAHRVPWGDQCSHAVVAGDDEIGLVSATSIATERNLAGEPRARLRFDSAPLVAFARLPGARARLELEGALARSVQMAGALERALDQALGYANERVQFGRPIGKFQAVQHMLAILAGQVAAAIAAAEGGVEASARAPDEFAVAVAKSRAGEAAGRGAEIAHQVHGAMGFTREHSLHYCTRRLWSWRDEFGNESYWQQRLGRKVAAAGADALWPMLTRS
ncbi:MAG: acyl-CoA dehydrogenase family protein [Pseudomonadota bacterium]